MLADAIRAEGFRLSKNRTALLWSTVFVPVMGVIFGAIGVFVMKASEARLSTAAGMPPELQQLLSAAPLNMAEVLVEAAGKLDNVALLLFVLIGTATLYAGDYRWETWRLISARNSRTNLLIGKVVVAALLALAAMGLLLVASIIEGLIRGVVFERALAFDLTGSMVGQFFAGAGLSWLRVIQFTMFGLLAGVVTRSLLAGLFIPLVLGVAQFLSPQMFAGMGIMPDAWIAVLSNPGGATDALKAWAMSPAGAPALPDGLVLKAWISLALWTALPLAGALAWFRRQDLSKE